MTLLSCRDPNIKLTSFLSITSHIKRYPPYKQAKPVSLNQQSCHLLPRTTSFSVSFLAPPNPQSTLTLSLRARQNSIQNRQEGHLLIQADEFLVWDRSERSERFSLDVGEDEPFAREDPEGGDLRVEFGFGGRRRSGGGGWGVGLVF